MEERKQERKEGRKEMGNDANMLEINKKRMQKKRRVGCASKE